MVCPRSDTRFPGGHEYSWTTSKGALAEGGKKPEGAATLTRVCTLSGSLHQQGQSGSVRMDHTSSRYSLFKDSIARRILSHPTTLHQTQDSSELDDFSSYLASEAWPTLPESIRTASYETRALVPTDIDLIPLDNTSVSFTDTLISYGFASDTDDSLRFLRNALASYLDDACAPPPVWSATRTTECEICEREVPLTYHHLIPRSTHAKALKKKWHPEAMLNSVAWLCRPCHSAVHHVATNEELAREYYTVELLLEREDILKRGRVSESLGGTTKQRGTCMKSGSCRPRPPAFGSFIGRHRELLIPTDAGAELYTDDIRKSRGGVVTSSVFSGRKSSKSPI
ncbi:hypothetical protein LshimejAT787_1204560 [Lyophyllum shimeji]|uniref:HNH domain-containing protein n=1 Tax=Lyophyllum shimeji TaxID=47721 RepID=A0A9P3PXD9_LYOSH|nr:hypothetical protein LshimejAT787_1204560 [Lyophyllum shimeji]